MDNQQDNKVNLKEEIKGQTTGYIVAALGLVAGLAWNEAIKALIDHLFPLSQNSLLAKFVYAILVTILVVIVTSYVVRVFKKK